MNETRFDIPDNARKIVKGDEFFTTDDHNKRRYNPEEGSLKDTILYDGYTVNIYHNHSYGEDHVVKQYKERITDGTGEYNEPSTGRRRVIKHDLNWKSYPISKLRWVLEKTIKKIHDEMMGFYDDDSMNDYLIISKSTGIVLRLMLTNINPTAVDDKRQIMINTVLWINMLHRDEDSYDRKLNHHFVDMEIVLVESKNIKYTVLYV